MHFQYGEKEIEYLKKRDKKLGDAIDKIGIIEREVNPDVFYSIIYNIVGQQISTGALKTIWNRIITKIGTINVENICALGRENLQQCGISFRKADYILSFAEKVKTGSFDIDALDKMTNKEVITTLSALDGIGIWTAEMILIFTLQRTDVISYGDMAILRGMRMLYQQKNVDRPMFEKYAKRYSPYGTVAGLYLWAISSGAIPNLKDNKEIKPKKVK